MSILTKETYQSSANPWELEGASCAAGTGIYWLLHSTWTWPARGGCGGTATVSHCATKHTAIFPKRSIPRGSCFLTSCRAQDQPAAALQGPGLIATPWFLALRQLWVTLLKWWWHCERGCSKYTKMFTTLSGSLLKKNPTCLESFWGFKYLFFFFSIPVPIKNVVNVVCLLFGERLNHWDPACWIIPHSVMANMQKWCSCPLRAGSSLLTGSIFQQGFKRLPSQCLHDSRKNITARHLSRKSIGNSQLAGGVGFL